jgi:NADPH:quinone reductase-like Zn-dependent oxidoreductase
MRLVQYAKYGGPEVLEIIEKPRPVPGVGEILVKVMAAGINPVDWKIRDGAVRAYIEYPFPVTPGGEISGVVEQFGTDPEPLAGKDIFALIGTTGAFADYIILPRETVVPKPASLDHIHAAAVPLAALTAWQALFDHGGVQTGHRVLIHAAAGGVGSFAVQFAALRGAHVIGTASKEKHEYVRSLGANEVINYRSESFETRVKNVDVVIDLVGGDVFERSKATLAPSGIVVTALGLGANEDRVRQVYVSPSTKQLAEIASLIDAGSIRVPVDSIYPLTEVAAAMEKSKGGRVAGKVVLTLE